MDLSKIPEPSESDLGYAKLLIEIVDYEKLTHQDKARSRIIAHLLRHGRVLANGLIESSITHGFPTGENERAAIEFFEKFGGNDER